LLLLDSFVLPALTGSSYTKVVPVEGVVGTIQIKSRATKSEVERAIANVASAKRLLSDCERYGVPLGTDRPGFWSTGASFFGGVLFLGSDRSDEHLSDAFCESVMKVPPRERCDAFCVLDRLSIVRGNPSQG